MGRSKLICRRNIDEEGCEERLRHVEIDWMKDKKIRLAAMKHKQDLVFRVKKDIMNIAIQHGTKIIQRIDRNTAIMP